jgi:phosphonate transport system substrate-binding protein
MQVPQPLRFSVSRSHGGTHPLDAARKFAELLGERLHSRVELKIAADYDDLTDSLLKGKVHIAWMPPLAHARATQKGALLAAVVERGGALTYRSALMVRSDSVHTSTNGLRGVRAAWTDPASASGYLYARLHLLHAGVDPRRDLASERFFGSSKAACAAVADGEADLCACYVGDGAYDDRALALADVERVLPGAREKLRVLDVTDRIPPDGVVLSDSLAPDAQAHLRDVLLDLHNQASGQAALKWLMQADRLRGVTSDVLKIIARLRAHVHVP